MPNKDKSLIVLVLDRSGSMGVIQEATIEGVNGFINAQKSLPGETEVFITQFDHEHLVHFDGDVKNFGLLTNETYIPRGSTALLDAIGFTIDKIGNKLRSRKEENRPGTVIFAIMTDGGENCSREYGGVSGRKRIFDMIKHQTDKYSWNFTFLGANQDAISVGAELGIYAANSMSFSSTSKGVQNMTAAVTRYSTAVRGGDLKNASYSVSERESAMEGDSD